MFKTKKTLEAMPQHKVKSKIRQLSFLFSYFQFTLRLMRVKLIVASNFLTTWGYPTRMRTVTNIWSRYRSYNV